MRTVYTMTIESQSGGLILYKIEGRPENCSWHKEGECSCGVDRCAAWYKCCRGSSRWRGVTTGVQVKCVSALQDGQEVGGCGGLAGRRHQDCQPQGRPTHPNHLHVAKSANPRYIWQYYSHFQPSFKVFSRKTAWKNLDKNFIDI